MARGGEVLIEEALAETVAGIGAEDRDRTAETIHLGAEPIDALEGGEVGLDGVHRRAGGSERLRRSLDLRFVSGNDELESVLPQQQRQFIADAGGRACYDGEGRVGGGWAM